MKTTSRQQQTQRTLLDWQPVEHAIEKPGNKLLAVAEPDSDTREKWIDGVMDCWIGGFIE